MATAHGLPAIYGQRRIRRLFAGIVRTLVGAAILAGNLGYVDINLAHLLRTWWAVMLNALAASYLVSPNR